MHELAEALAFRLAKLDAIRRAVDALHARPQLKRDVFPRGDPQAVTVRACDRLEGDLHGLVMAYITQRKREAARRYAPGAAGGGLSAGGRPRPPARPAPGTANVDAAG